MAWAALRPVVKACIGGSLIGITISDRYFSFATVHGGSMCPTFDGSTGGREYALVKRSPLYDYARGEVVVFVSPTDHRSQTIKRLIGLPGDWISVPEKEEIRKIPEGHCWVEGDNGSVSRDSRDYGPVPLGLVQGRVTARGVATRQDGPRRQEGASGRKGHAGAKSLVHLSSLLGCFVPQFCSFLQDINVTMRQEEDIALLRIANVAQLLVSRLDPL